MMSPELDAQFVARLSTAFAAQLPEFLPNQRWFGSKARQIHSVRLSGCVPVQLSQSVALIALASVVFVEGPGETYVLPLLAAAPDRVCPADTIVVRLPVSDAGSELRLIDALGDTEFLTAVLNAIVNSRSLPGQNGVLRATSEPALSEKKLGALESLVPRLLKVEQSNTSIVYGDQFILKFFRRVEEGIHPDLEIGRFLTSVAHFSNTPLLYGSLSYESREQKVLTLGILQAFVPNRGDAWRFIVDSLAELFTSLDHRIGEQLTGSKRPPLPNSELDFGTPEASRGLEKQLELIGLLGKRTAELHLALASSSDDPAFAPEPFTPEVLESMERAFHDLAVHNFGTLRLKLAELPEPISDLAKQVLALEDDALLVLHSISEKDISEIRIRIHGDYHLGQVLFTGSDYFIIDFEGEPARPLSERRNKRSPLQDVASMLRSFHYAARAASLAASERLAVASNSVPEIAVLAAQWQASASREFLHSYRATAGDAKFLPSDPGDFDAFLKVHLLEKAIYELGYELNNRPSWLAIPLEGIRDILTSEE
jgi:maltose alpha-D-glucosyltransferase/alpha-amylase